MTEPKFIKSVFNLEDLPADLRPQVALVGRSNVGKSSMVNALGGKQGLARVSREPGRTQTLNFYELDKSYFLVDLPGYGFARGRKGRKEIFLKLITDYLQESASLAIVFVVVDARLGPTPLDVDMLAFLKKADIPHAIICSKTDKLTNSELITLQRQLAKEFPNVAQHFHSVHESKGRGEIRRTIELIVRKAAQK
jgi:GTP-binding protein